MELLKSKFFWLNIIAIVVLIIQYFIDNEMLAEYVKWEALAVVVLNAIAGMIQSQQTTTLKKQIKKLQVK